MKRYMLLSFSIMALAGFGASDAIVFAEDRGEIVGTWEFVSQFGDEATQYTFVVPQDGDATFDNEPVKDLEFEENFVAFTFTLGEKGKRAELQFEGTLDDDVIVGEFLFSNSVVALVDGKRITARAEASIGTQSKGSVNDSAIAGDELYLEGKTFI